MFISERVFQNLELDYIFNRITVYTPYGEQCKKEMKPFLREEKEFLLEEYNRIEKVVSLLEKHRYTFVEMRSIFKHIKDLRGSFKRIEEDEVLSTVELFEIKSFLFFLLKLDDLLKKLKWNVPKNLKIMPMPSLMDLLDPEKSGVNTFYIYDAYSKKLQTIRKKIKDIESQIHRSKKEAREALQKELNIKIRPNGEVLVNKSNREMVEALEKCKGLIYSSETYMNITFKVKLDESLDEKFKELDELKLQEEEEEFIVRTQLTQELKKKLDDFYRNIKAIGALDLLIAKGYLAVGMKGVKPQVSDVEKLHIVEGRHIKVADTLRKQGKEFTPITVNLKKGVTCITGANMGGKTISLKLIGILSAMAQYGLFVPAKAMTFSLKDYIFFSLGDLQSTDMGLSTFGAEILEIKKIIERVNERGLILIDELARGTNPAEGYAISKAIINFLKNKNTITVVTSHFDGLTDDEEVYHLQVKGLEGIDYETLKQEIESQCEFGIEIVHKYMDYRLIEVKNKNKVPRDAINIARLMGLQEVLLKEAESHLEKC
ncbi:DNA mismatch repair protein MutS [Crassaminicella thermophila]|uniref:DNA mismatch repair protein MutS n=1 Tax=Crassaminicella thermophila TaxID=2599308 RepID=A0A5C0SF55_CRATE|nr:DNA mismatch repair protein MutS [Crassaminicella thermophila]QEK13265.1 DNA mismatch repair protein MutS [Crassaminicella thermophila]